MSTATQSEHSTVDKFTVIVQGSARREVEHMAMEGLVDQLAAMRAKLQTLEAADSFENDRNIERLKIRIQVYEDARQNRLRRAEDNGC